jgi:hypothetical protein
VALREAAAAGAFLHCIVVFRIWTACGIHEQIPTFYIIALLVDCLDEVASFAVKGKVVGFCGAASPALISTTCGACRRCVAFV